jgi:hypothetical protein
MERLAVEVAGVWQNNVGAKLQTSFDDAPEGPYHPLWDDQAT